MTRSLARRLRQLRQRLAQLREHVLEDNLWWSLGYLSSLLAVLLCVALLAYALAHLVSR